MIKGKTVFVGLSGGVDSSVAALRLKTAGYTVVGVFIRVWHPDFVLCTEEQDRIDAMRVAAHLSIPFLTCDAREEYKALVADEMVREYERGHVPNPDILCNKIVKFGVFEAFRKRHNADFIATGHYARTVTENGVTLLQVSADAKKDQSYFLSMISKEMLPHVLFPIGNTVKSDIRTEARTAGLPSAERPDSQGICFLGKLDIKDYLSHYIETIEGDVVDTEGKRIGTHDGALYYTIGQRHGFSVTSNTTDSEPQYVVAKDIEKNEIIVDSTPPTCTLGDTFTLSELNALTTARKDGQYEVVTRYHGPRTKAFVSFTSENAHVRLEEASERPSVGQTCVIYDNDIVVAGGIIEQ